MPDNSFVLAGDVGGTNLRIAAVGCDGGILEHVSANTPQSAHDIIRSIVGMAESCLAAMGEKRPPLAFGLALAALVNTNEGRLLSSPNLPQLNDLELAPIVSSELKTQVVLENDATAAAVGEQWLGASKDTRHSIFVTLGTGIGGGLILDGRPYRGADGTAGEIGHIVVEPDGIQCGCGGRGCVEQYASATAIVRIAKELVEQHPDSSLHKVPLTAKDLFESAVAGDPVAIETFRIMGSYLGVALADLIDVLNPELIVIGGGAAGGWDFFIDALRSKIKAHAFKHPGERVRLVRASLGNSAGILGAARVAFDAVTH